MIFDATKLRFSEFCAAPPVQFIEPVSVTWLSMTMARNYRKSRALPLGLYAQELPRHRIDLGEIYRDLLISTAGAAPGSECDSLAQEKSRRRDNGSPVTPNATGAPRCRRPAPSPQVRFAQDSPLEERGFEPPVPPAGLGLTCGTGTPQERKGESRKGRTSWGD
jgi:hypothetical protein